MGKRARRRGDDTVPAPGKKPDTWADRFIAAGEQRPKAPWHPVPLVELCVLAGIVLIVVGFIDFQDRQGRILLALGLVLASLAGLDTAVRDHFAGFRSHTMLLAGVPAVLVAGVLFYARVPWPAVVAAAAAAFIAGVILFQRQFRRRSGGYAFKA
jgi:lysylphosphatidylglycerol synthetase-like protein (DUF2156 family)